MTYIQYLLIHDIWQYQHVFSMYVHVWACICMYMYICACIWFMFPAQHKKLWHIVLGSLCKIRNSQKDMHITAKQLWLFWSSNTRLQPPGAQMALYTTEQSRLTRHQKWWNISRNLSVTYLHIPVCTSTYMHIPTQTCKYMHIPLHRVAAWTRKIGSWSGTGKAR